MYAPHTHRISGTTNGVMEDQKWLTPAHHSRRGVAQSEVVSLVGTHVPQTASITEMIVYVIITVSILVIAVCVPFATMSLQQDHDVAAKLLAHWKATSPVVINVPASTASTASTAPNPLLIIVDEQNCHLPTSDACNILIAYDMWHEHTFFDDTIQLPKTTYMRCSTTGTVNVIVDTDSQLLVHVNTEGVHRCYCPVSSSDNTPNDLPAHCHPIPVVVH
jgi:hypothetical protein